jgi:hypothetical protein
MLHSRFFEEAFWNFEMPQDLIDGYGFPPLTEEVKRKILGLNAARLLGIDVDELKSRRPMMNSPSRAGWPNRGPA